MSEQTENAYRYCESVTKTHAKSFYFAAKFLPKHKQRPIYAVYALCRSVDDEVDEAEVSSAREAVEAVRRWETKLKQVYESVVNSERLSVIEEEKQPNLPLTIHHSPFVLLAWKDLLKTYKIPQTLPLELMKGVVQDTHIKRYETFAELYVYCYRVASTVGLMSSEIFGYTEPETLCYAESLGIAMQLTNILRDVKEDAAMDRIYLPQEDLRKFNVSENQIFEGKMNENFVSLIKFQIQRAREFYRKSYKGISLLDEDARFTVLLALRIYSQILDEIERQNYDVFQKRAHTSFRQKVFSVPKIWLEAKNF